MQAVLQAAALTIVTCSGCRRLSPLSDTTTRQVVGLT